jgi:K+ transporter
MPISAISVPGPIRLAWSFVLLPSLALNYAGQAAIILDGGSIEGNIFYQLCPPYVEIINWVLLPVTVGLAIAFRKSDNLAAAYGIVSATISICVVDASRCSQEWLT